MEEGRSGGGKEGVAKVEAASFLLGSQRMADEVGASGGAERESKAKKLKSPPWEY